MAETIDPVKNVAFCGLYCGNCGKFKSGKCPGCPSFEEGKAPSWCKTRPCAIEKGYSSCGECSDWRECKTLNNFMSKVFGIIFRSNRKGMLAYIEENGMEKYAELMANHGSMRFPKELK